MNEGNAQHGDDGVETIFHTAMAFASQDERSAYIDSVCANDAELRSRVQRLLDAEDRAGKFMHDTSGATSDAGAAPKAEPGDLMGPYKLLQVIGEGGMGTVYMADQTEPVERRVALKILKPGMDTREVVARFEAERQALALMDHPGIAKVLDAGATDSGRPYFAMELVKGVPITEYCDQHRLKPRRRLELFLHVCRAVHHAHQKGVIHRDIKPANVLVADYDHKAVPKVIDFGVAKAMGQKLTDKTMFTQFGQIIGTFEYMSPEQAKLNQLDVDTRADIYSLGVLLYELLTGTTPFERGRLQVVDFDELLRIIREEEPPKPSTRISSLGDRTVAVAASRGGDARQLSRSLSGELDWIVMRAIEKDRNRRYESAAAMGDDVERYLADEAVHACPPSAAYRASKFVRRHRGPVITAAALMVVLILGLVGTSYGLVEATKERERAEGINFKMAVDRGIHLCEDGNVGHGLLWLARALEQCPDDDSAMERVVRANLNAWRRELNALEAVFPHEAPALSVAFNPQGDRLVTGSEDRTAQIWNLSTNEPVGEPLQHGGDVHELAFTADGTRLLSADYRRTAYIWDALTGKPIHTMLHGSDASLRDLAVLSATGGVLGAAFRPPDEAELVTSCGDGSVVFWDAKTGKEMGRLPEDAHQNMAHDIAVSKDGSRILTSSHDRTAKLWDYDSRALLATFRHDSDCVTADFCGDDRIVTGDATGNILLWSIERAMADEDKTLEHAAEEHLAVWRQRGTIHRLRVSDDGTRILAASFDSTAQLWDPDQVEGVGPGLEHQAAVWGVAFAPDGERVATACDDNTARVWHPAPGQSVRKIEHEVKFDHETVFSRDGRYVLIKTDNENCGVSDSVTKAPLCVLRHPGGIRAFAVTPNGSHVLTGGADGICRVWDVKKAAPAFDAFRHGGGVWSVDISSDGTRALTGGFDRVVQVRDIRTGKVLRELRAAARVWGLHFNPDATQLVFGCSDKRAYVYGTAAETPPLVLTGHMSAVFGTLFSRDGRRILSGSHDSTVRVWDAATGKPVSNPLRHTGPISYALGAAFSPDGNTVVTSSGSGSVRVWDIGTARPVGPALKHESRVNLVAFPSEREIRTGTADGKVRLWDAERSAIRGEPARIRLWIEVITGFELDDDGVLRALDVRDWKDRSARLREVGGAPAAGG
ncbi:MAG: serine/threonine-protein kinase [Planctomycetota bacterium]